AIKALHGFETPVYAGCARPLAQRQTTAQDVLGAHGMETTGAPLPAAGTAPEPAHAVQAFIDTVRANPGRITLLAIGPLTNIATAFALAPDLPGLLADIVIMGGSTVGGNSTAAAEFNIHADPEAAARVFDCGVPVAMFGLNVCRQVTVSAAEVERLQRIGGERAAVFAGYLDGYVGIARRRGRPFQSVYDPTPVIWLARPDLFELQSGRVEIELAGRHTRGMTVCDLRAPAQARANARVAMKADGVPALEWAMQRLENLLGGAGRGQSPR
ncbi:MAG: nucleoside hydrolase, partial [Burkholderiales bacterium]|nr:nucleoside hydrolase [Burkholderiales bacterium]